MEEIPNGCAAYREKCPEPIKIIVVGEPGCGKTTFIKSFYNIAKPVPVYFLSGIEVHECKYEFGNKMRYIALAEIPSDFSDMEEERKWHYYEADIFIFMFDLTEVGTFHNLRDAWVKEAKDFIIERSVRVVAFVANKSDIGSIHDFPVPFSQMEALIPKDDRDIIISDISSLDVAQVVDLFKQIMRKYFPTCREQF